MPSNSLVQCISAASTFLSTKQQTARAFYRCALGSLDRFLREIILNTCTHSPCCSVRILRGSRNDQLDRMLLGVRYHAADSLIPCPCVGRSSCINRRQMTSKQASDKKTGRDQCSPLRTFVRGIARTWEGVKDS